MRQVIQAVDSVLANREVLWQTVDAIIRDFIDPERIIG
jgi:hypothetical protein